MMISSGSAPGSAYSQEGLLALLVSGHSSPSDSSFSSHTHRLRGACDSGGCLWLPVLPTHGPFCTVLSPVGAVGYSLLLPAHSPSMPFPSPLTLVHSALATGHSRFEVVR